MRAAIRRLREELKMTQEVFAKTLGKSISTIDKYEAEPPPDLVSQLVALALENNLRDIAEELDPGLIPPFTGQYPKATAKWHRLLQTVLENGGSKQKEWLTGNLVTFVDNIRMLEELQRLKDGPKTKRASSS